MVKIFQVDSFTGEPFKGNPAAVSILESPLDESWMQDVATEMNLSETAFVSSDEATLNRFNLRWFTPVKEVSLCGHATLAAAHILWETGTVKDYGEIVFSTLSGELRLWREGKLIWMDFPADKPKPVEPPVGFFVALGLSAAHAETLEVFKGISDYLVEFGSVLEVLNLSPDFAELKKIEARGVIVTAGGEDGAVDFVSRFFAPAIGIDEDPVTGSAHCTLAPYWALKLGKAELNASQLSKRGGRICMRMVKAGSEARVHLGGRAVTSFSGELS